MRNLPGQDPRVESGALQFGDDWPGLFIRGDQCLHYLHCIRTALQHDHDLMTKLTLESLIEMLQEPLPDSVREAYEKIRTRNEDKG